MYPPALTPEAREQQLIQLAMNLAEKKIRDGTAPASLIIQVMRFGTESERLKQENLRVQNELNEAKRVAIQSEQRLEELTQNAIKAFSIYSGEADDYEYEEYEEYDPDL